MEYKLKKEAADIITENILTPIIYMLEDEKQAEFVCFCDENILSEVFIKTEEQLEKLLNRTAVIFDIREYSPIDRIEIINDGEIIYTANPVFERMITASLMEDIQKNQIQKANLLKRYNSSGSVYLQ